MAKLIDDPAVAALVAKSSAAAVKTVLKSHVALIKAHGEELSSTSEDKSLAKLHRTSAADLVRAIKAAHAEAAE